MNIYLQFIKEFFIKLNPQTYLNQWFSLSYQLDLTNFFFYIFLIGPILMTIIIFLTPFFFKNPFILNIFIKKLEQYSEFEFGSFNNLINFFIIIFSIYFIDILFFSTNTIFISYNSLLIWIFILIGFIIIVLPIHLIIDYGFLFISFIKGSSTKNSFIFELLIDYIHLMSFFLRINIQLIRFLIITIYFYLYNELYDEYIYNYYISINSMQNNKNNFFIFFYLQNISHLILYLLYEIGHFFIILTIQKTAFSMTLIILIQLLYTSYLFYKIEVYFIKYRKHKKLL